MQIARRHFLSMIGSCLAVPCAATKTSAAPKIWAAESGHDRCKAMLMGSLIGDAMGGPIEFLSADQLRGKMPGARDWEPSRKIDDDTLKQLASSVPLFSYQQLRPDTAPYGPWERMAPAGTITDDSRHKIVVIRAVRKALENNRAITKEDLAKAIIEFSPHVGQEPSEDLRRLVEEGMREYRLAANWILGERDEAKALPVERLWAGVNNCSGQMALLPLACLYAGDPERAYRETYRIDFIDAPIARDIVSALVAGLAAVIGSRADSMTPSQRWKLLVDTMRSTDPYRMRDVPFAGRQLDRWLDLSESIANRSDGRPAEAYRLLVDEGKPVYYWDAHFTLLVPLTMLRLTQFEPLAALHLTLDFGHDTDSYAQVLGAMAGAVHGMDIWEQPWQEAIRDRLLEDYGESVDQWTDDLSEYASKWSR